MTDEQLIQMCDSGRSAPHIVAMATELLALRAERAKPMQSDVERATAAISVAVLGYSHNSATGDELPGVTWESLNNAEKSVAAAFASIRAEGSAKRAKIEAALELAVSRGCDHCAESIRQARSIFTGAPGERCDIAKPAERGATDIGTLKGTADDQGLFAISPLCGDCPPVGYPTDETRCTPCPRRAGAKP